MREKVFICSRISGKTPAEFERNRADMRMYARYAILMGYDPEATGDYYCNILDEHSPEERALGLALGRERLEGCDWMLVVHDERGVSSGMQGDIDHARAKAIKLIHWSTREIVVYWLKEHDPAFERWREGNERRTKELEGPPIRPCVCDGKD